MNGKQTAVDLENKILKRFFFLLPSNETGFVGHVATAPPASSPEPPHFERTGAAAPAGPKPHRRGRQTAGDPAMSAGTWTCGGPDRG